MKKQNHKEEFNLSEKRIDEGMSEPYYMEEDVKQKIQNAQRRLKEEIINEVAFMLHNSSYDIVGRINKIFKEEFGEEMLK